MSRIRWVVVLVEHLIGLEIDAPVAGAGVECDVRLHGVDGALDEVLLVPVRLDDPDLGVADGPDGFQGVVDTLADGDDELVYHGEGRADGLGDRVVEAYGIAAEGESGDFHG